MNRHLISALALLTLPTAAVAAPERSTSFKVGNLTCPTCPIAVKTAMSRVPGVSRVTVDFTTKVATVTYDPARATPTAIAAASTKVGYPARIAAR
ncbi:hypothetical protein ASE86_06245 [Sphingomonas sp. Leaf33]|uniref:heavy-metal-associated domain-containing protein n=1 Tax=Sphingomonas sp. Leaf33 TaxID=1736215 RepID=UPI0006F20609|nr:heavy metal-associated domain-containing protein [Sphingomonas sp. Leaf33]KQN25800.1 hypothetical protein ASE86_06245 [Sphingomonas sp. Leaf33]